MTAFIAPGLIAAPPPPPGARPRVHGTFRGAMTPRGEPDPDGGAAYVGFDNEHGAAVREILQTTGDYVGAIEKATPVFEIDVDFETLPTTSPPAGSGKFWNNNGTICVA